MPRRDFLLNLPLPTTPIADLPRGGQPTDAWYQYFLTLFQRVGGAAGSGSDALQMFFGPTDSNAELVGQAALQALALSSSPELDSGLADQILMRAMMLAPISESTVIMSGGHIVPPGAIMLISPVFAQDIDTAPGPQSFTLPTSPEDGEQWRVKDATGHAQANHITVDAGGVAIDGGTTAVLNQNYMARTFRWSPAYSKWIIE